MRYFALTYDVVPGFVDRRVAHRDAHLKRVREAHDRGELMLAGAIGDPPDGALLVFRVESAAVVEEFARADPYVTEALVTAWRVRPWHIVIGTEPALPRPL